MPLNLPIRSKGRPRTTKPTITTTVISSDWHIPFHDVAAYHAFKHFIGHFRPDYHVIAGDYLDATSLSKFLKDPSEANRTEEELLLGNQILDELYQASPTTITKFISGNHEKRLTRSLWEVPEILPFVTRGKTPEQVLAECLSLDGRGISYVGYPAGIFHQGLYITHGEATGLHSAKKELLTHGVTGVSGHCHSNKYWEQRGRNGVTQWWSIGGLCSREVSYRPNNGWVQGFAIALSVEGTETVQVIPVTINRGQFVYESRLFTQDGVFESK